MATYFAAVSRRRGIFFSILLLCLAAAFAITVVQPTVYRATAQVAVDPATEQTELERLLFGGAELGTQREILRSRSVVERALREAGRAADDDEVRRLVDQKLSIETVPDTTILEVSVDDRSRSGAKLLTQAVAEAYIAQQREEADRRLKLALARLATDEASARGRLRSLEAQIAAGTGTIEPSLEEERDQTYAQLRLLAERAAELQTTLGFAQRANIVEDAALLPAPVAPKPLLNLLLGLVLGAAAGAAAAVWRDAADSRVGAHVDFAALGAGKLLGHVRPQEDAGGRLALDEEQRETFRILRAEVTANPRALRAAEQEVVAIVGVSSDDDPLQIAAALAASFASTGEVCVFVDTSFTPAGRTAFGVAGGVGLSDVLTRRVALPDAFVEVQPGLKYLPAGTDDAGATDQLAGPAFRQTLSDLASDVDHVVLSASAAPTSGLDVCSHAQRAVLVATTAVTTKAAVAEAVRGLEQRGVAVVGTLLYETAPSPSVTSSTPSVTSSTIAGPTNGAAESVRAEAAPAKDALHAGP